MDLQALVGAARSERSTAVKRSYAQAAAAVIKYAPEARAAKVVAEAAALYSDPGTCLDLQAAGTTPLGLRLKLTCMTVLLCR